jgi:hypothetical protein
MMKIATMPMTTPTMPPVVSFSCGELPPLFCRSAASPVELGAAEDTLVLVARAVDFVDKVVLLIVAGVAVLPVAVVAAPPAIANVFEIENVSFCDNMRA